jgi:threonylcarbamoyladenosine tRNA methylthiotransferase MtaB
MKYSVITFGCRVNQADSLGFEEQLRAWGASAAPAEDADLVVVNTCSVTASADQGARQAIRRVSRVNPAARIVVTGCYATRRPAEVGDLPNVACVVPNDDKHRLVQLLSRVRSRESGPEVTTAERFGRGDGSCGESIGPGASGRTGFTLRVQTGCAESCSYCIIPTTRGEPRSLPIDRVVAEVRRVARAGFKEIAMTGVHLGSYGRDLSPPVSLGELLAVLHTMAIAAPSPEPLRDGDRREPAVRFRLSSLEPMDCTPAIVSLVADSDRLAPHFHLPLQHASARMLEAMKRPYTIQQYAALADDIRARIPHAAIGSDVIVGFPDETEDDFEQLETYLQSSPLTHVHVFPYSDRPGTAASSMSGKVHGGTIRERARRIRAVSERLMARFRRSQVGEVRTALTLEDGCLAVTGNYMKVRIPPGRLRNQWVRIRLTSEHDGELLGG